MIDSIVHNFFCCEIKNRLNITAANFETETFLNRETFTHFVRKGKRDTERKVHCVYAVGVLSLISGVALTILKLLHSIFFPFLIQFKIKTEAPCIRD